MRISNLISKSLGNQTPGSTRLNSINGAARIIDLAGEDRFLVLQEAETGDMVFKDWNTGAESRLPVDVTVAAIFL